MEFGLGPTLSSVVLGGLVDAVASSKQGYTVERCGMLGLRVPEGFGVQDSGCT